MTIQDVYNAVLTFDPTRVQVKVQAELDANTDIPTILDDGLISAMDEAGERFSAGDFFFPEMLMAAQAMKAGLEIIRPLFATSQSQTKGTVIVGTVKGDLHDIGKNIISIMFEGAGFDVLDLGVDVDSKVFVQAAAEKNADVIALSALLTTTMPAMAQTITASKEAGLAAKILVGGAPLSQAFAEEIGADGFSADAPGAVKLIKQLVP